MAQCGDLTEVLRLNKHYDNSLRNCLEQKRQFEKVTSDYQALSTRLSTLSDKVSHEVMVPFGSLAFMPGKLVHTNEIMVLLGDNWFVQRSTKQATEIVKRRMTATRKMLEDLEKEENQIMSWIEYSQKVTSQDLTEIQEEFDVVKEEAWRKQHHQSVLKQKQNDKAAVSAKPKDYFKILHQLSIEEREKAELDDDEQDWVDIPDDSTETDEEIHAKMVPNCITFSHTVIDRDSNIQNTINSSTTAIIQSPEDIYKQFAFLTVKPSAKSILKRNANQPGKKQTNHVHFANEVLEEPEKVHKTMQPIKTLVLSETVVEKCQTEIMSVNREVTESKRPASKFKALRTLQQSEETQPASVEDSNTLLETTLRDTIEKDSKQVYEQTNKPVTAFSAILERANYELMKPSDFKDSTKVVSKFKTQRQKK